MSFGSEILNDMQKHNSPDVFGIDANGNQTGSHYSQFGGNPAIPSQGQPQGQGITQSMPQQGHGNTNPELLQKFLYIISNIPQLSQYFNTNTKAYEDHTKSPGLMMEIIAKYEPYLSQQPIVNQPQQPMSINNESPQSNQQSQPSPADTNPNNVVLSDLSPLDKPMSWGDTLWNILKYPLLISILFYIFLMPSVKTFIINNLIDYIPSIGQSENIKTLAITSAFFIFSVVINEILKYKS
jgi:hypothetical protein